jgi:hypothetical protein
VEVYSERSTLKQNVCIVRSLSVQAKHLFLASAPAMRKLTDMCETILVPAQRVSHVNDLDFATEIQPHTSIKLKYFEMRLTGDLSCASAVVVWMAPCSFLWLGVERVKKR